jgi:hypothetical protein
MYRHIYVLVRREQPGQAEQDCQYRTARTAPPGQGCHDRTARIRSARAGPN